MQTKFTLGKTSMDNLMELHPKLIKLLTKVSQITNIRILEGNRSKTEQNKLYHAGKSKLKFPHSKHNQSPSLAADVAPYPIDWEDKNRFYYLAGIIMGVASELGYKIRWGGDWDMDGSFKDQTFNDLPHFELIA